MSVLFNFLNSINDTKEDLLVENPDLESDYVPFLINRGLSMGYDTVMYGNEMNMHHHLSKKQQYDFLRVVIPKKKRYNKWAKKDALSDDVMLISAYYKYNKEQAIKALSLLTEEQINIIRNRMDKGGLIKNE